MFTLVVRFAETACTLCATNTNKLRAEIKEHKAEVKLRL